MKKQLDKNQEELEILEEKLKEEEKKKKEKPMKLHGASLRNIQRIQEKRKAKND